MNTPHLPASSRRGETAVQYVLIAAIISVGIIVALQALGVSVADIWGLVAKTVGDAV